MTTLSKLSTCFRQALTLSDDVDLKALRYQTIPSWDSVGHMRLVAAIETEFNIMFTTDQILDMSDFEKAIDIVVQHGISSES